MGRLEDVESGYIRIMLQQNFKFYSEERTSLLRALANLVFLNGSVNRNIASCQGPTGFIAVQILDLDIKSIRPRLLEFAQHMDLHFELNQLLIARHPCARNPDMVAFDHKQLEGCGFQTQVGCVVLIS